MGCRGGGEGKSDVSHLGRESGHRFFDCNGKGCKPWEWRGAVERGELFRQKGVRGTSADLFKKSKKNVNLLLVRTEMQKRGGGKKKTKFRIKNPENF